MKIVLPMTTQEVLREFVTESHWNTVEELAEILGVTLETEYDPEEDECYPVASDEDVARIMEAIPAFVENGQTGNAAARHTGIPGIIEMEGATVDVSRVRAMRSLGLDPRAMLMLAAAIGDIEVQIEDGDHAGTFVEADVVERGTLSTPGGHIAITFTTPSFHWGDDQLRVFGRQMPHVMMPGYEGRPLDELVDHPMTRGLGLVIAGIGVEDGHLDIALVEDRRDWNTANGEQAHAALA